MKNTYVMKKCNIVGCKNNIFSKGLCLYHWKIQHQKPIKIKKGQKGIKKLSKRREMQMDTYYAYKEKMAKLVLKTPLRCFFSNTLIVYDINKKKYINFDIHHLLGREEKKLTEFSYCVPVLREYHTQYHNLDILELKNLRWYDNFLNKIKVNYPIVYNKELLKHIKVGIITNEEYLIKITKKR